MGAFMPITNSIIITNITELTNIINSNIIQTNFITEIITNTTTSLGDPTLWITLFGAIFTAITAGIMLRSVKEMKRQYEEINRPYLQVYYKNESGKFNIYLQNTSHQVARNINITFNPIFKPIMRSIQLMNKVKKIEYISSAQHILVSGFKDPHFKDKLLMNESQKASVCLEYKINICLEYNQKKENILLTIQDLP